MIDHEEKIIEALVDIPGLKHVGDTYPEGLADVPSIIVELASDRVVDWRDDKPYLRELEYYLRLYGASKRTMRRILAEMDSRMDAIGYWRIFRREQSDADVKLWNTTYRTNAYNE